MNELTTQCNDIEVCAETPDEMKAANQTLIVWCENKINQLRVEQIELEASRDMAKDKGWNSKLFARHVLLAKKRIEFYSKTKRALEAGYYIVPTFPVSVFAIRTHGKLRVVEGTSRHDTHEQHAPALPTGTGIHANPFPVIYQKDEITAEQKTIRKYFAEHWRDIEFPFNMAKPRIMEATSRAMALKIFDDFGVLPSDRRNIDPLIVARIKDPRSTTYNRRFISFIIAWALDTKTL